MADNLTRDELIYMAKVCEQTERFEDMLDYMKKVLKCDDKDLSVEDRNLLSVAYKNCVGTKRTSWRILDTLEKKERAKGEGDQKNLTLVVEFKKKVEKELDEICKEIIKTLDETLIPNSKEASSKVFYLKMKGDYFRYIAEYNLSSDKKDESIPQQAFEAYSKANEIAATEMETTDPIRLGLALNFSVFYYEIRNDPKQACQLAKTAFDDAIADIENI